MFEDSYERQRRIDEGQQRREADRERTERYAPIGEDWFEAKHGNRQIVFSGRWITIQQHGWEGTEYCYYLVINTRTHRHIGKIAMRGRGKKWWFMPFNGAEFTHDCMADITRFMGQLQMNSGAANNKQGEKQL